MLNALSEISSVQLQRAVVIKERIEALERDLSEILGNASSAPAPATKAAKGRGTISAAGRARIIAAQKARWARQRRTGTTGTTTAAKPKRRVSAAARAKMAAVAKARWAKAKAAGRSAL